MTWRALSTPSKSLFFWDDECVVFNHLSGDTHLLSALAGQILLKLQQTPEDVVSLDAGTVQPCAVEAGSEFDSIVAELSALALIESV
jgi:PqqD family protein of HPr-rel-A system